MFLGGVYLPRVLPAGGPASGSATSRPPACRACRTPGWAPRRSWRRCSGWRSSRSCSARSPCGCSGGSDAAARARPSPPTGAWSSVASMSVADEARRLRAVRRRCWSARLRLRAARVGDRPRPARGAGGPDRTAAHHPGARGRGGRLDLRALSRGSPQPRRDDRARMRRLLRWACWSSASILMLRQSVFFVFMIAASSTPRILRPLPLAVVGVGATVDPRQQPRRGPAADARGVDVLPRDHLRPDGRHRRRGSTSARRITEQNEERRQALARLEAALDRERRACTPSC